MQFPFWLNAGTNRSPPVEQRPDPEWRHRKRPIAAPSLVVAPYRQCKERLCNRPAYSCCPEWSDLVYSSRFFCLGHFHAYHEINAVATTAVPKSRL